MLEHWEWEMPVCSVSMPWGSEMEWNRYRGRQGSVISDAFCYPESYLQISGKNNLKRENKVYLNISVPEICLK